jgi:hypothetical protein
MSHTSTIKAIKIQSITALQAAIAELNQMGVRLTLAPNATPRAYFPNQPGLGKADYVIQLADAKYDIGLYKDGDNGYEARTDFWAGSVEGILGAPARTPENALQAKMGRLFQMYGVMATMEQCRRKGQTVRRLTKQDGTIALEITGNM